MSGRLNFDQQFDEPGAGKSFVAWTRRPWHSQGESAHEAREESTDSVQQGWTPSVPVLL
jgi:hypothetical protein